MRSAKGNRAKATQPTAVALTRIARAEPGSELDKFVYIVSHDLRNCARAITEVPQWLQDDLQEQGVVLTADMQENFDLLDRHARRMDRMLLDLLMYSRVGRLQEVETFSLNHLIEGLLDEARLPDHVQVHAAPDLPQVTMGFRDAFVLCKCVVDNVVRHGASSGSMLTIDAACEGKSITVQFIDNGPGIDPKDLERAFQPMTTLRRRDEVEGSGMGLAIIQRIATHYGGDVFVGPGMGGTGLRIDVTLEVSGLA